jgi:hypothetical protein
MGKDVLDADEILRRATPLTQQTSHEIQPFGHQMQVWFLAEHVVDSPAVRA